MGRGEKACFNPDSLSHAAAAGAGWRGGGQDGGGKRAEQAGKRPGPGWRHGDGTDRSIGRAQ